jgi:hypothetical protein
VCSQRPREVSPHRGCVVPAAFVVAANTQFLLL